MVGKDDRISRVEQVGMTTIGKERRELWPTLDHCAEQPAAGAHKLSTGTPGVAGDLEGTVQVPGVTEERLSDPGQLALTQIAEELLDPVSQVIHGECQPRRPADQLGEHHASLAAQHGLVERIVMEQGATTGRVPVADVLGEQHLVPEPGLEALTQRG